MIQFEYVKKVIRDLGWVKNNHLEWIGVAFLVVATGVLVGIVTICFQFTPLGETSPNGTAVLGRLATMQASVLAIVFSVGLVALQFIEQRHSSEIVTNIIYHPVFNLVFVLFVGSIGFDLLLLYLMPNPIGEISAFLTTLAASVAVICALSLLVLVSTAADLTNPSKSVDAYIDMLQRNPQKILKRENERHFLLPITEFIEIEFENGNTHTASIVSESLNKYSVDISISAFIKERSTDDDVTILSRWSVDEFLEPLTNTYYPRLFYVSLDKGNLEVAKQTYSTWFCLMGILVECENYSSVQRGAENIVSTIEQHGDDYSDTAYEIAGTSVSLLADWMISTGTIESTIDVIDTNQTLLSNAYKNQQLSSDLMVTIIDANLQSMAALLSASDIDEESQSWKSWHELSRECVGIIIQDQKQLDTNIRILLKDFYSNVISECRDRDDDAARLLITDLLQVALYDVQSELNDIMRYQSETSSNFNHWCDAFADLRQETSNRWVRGFLSRTSEPVDFGPEVGDFEGEYTMHQVAGPVFRERNSFSNLGFDMGTLFSDDIHMLSKILKYHSGQIYQRRRVIEEDSIQQLVSNPSILDSDIVNLQVVERKADTVVLKGEDSQSRALRIVLIGSKFEQAEMVSKHMYSGEKTYFVTIESDVPEKQIFGTWVSSDTLS